MGASRNSYKPVYFYTCIKIYSFYTSFIRVCLPKLSTRLYLYKCLYLYNLVYFFKKISLFCVQRSSTRQSSNAGTNTAKGEIPLLVRFTSSC
jgi:hypothetical protein